MPSGVARKTGKKNRKWNRNKLFCQAYRNENRREKNKARKLLRHLRKHSNDNVAVGCFDKLKNY
jgi:hypothetical protein